MLPKVTIMARPSSAHARLPAITSPADGPEDRDHDPYDRVVLIPVSVPQKRHQAWMTGDLLTSPGQFLPLATKPHHLFNGNGYSSTSPVYSSSSASPPSDDVGRKLSTLENEMLDKFHDLDLLKREVNDMQHRKQHRTRHRIGSFDLMPLRASPQEEDSLEAEVLALKRDKRIMSDLLKQSQRNLAKRDLIIEHLKKSSKEKTSSEKSNPKEQQRPVEESVNRMNMESSKDGINCEEDRCVPYTNGHGLGTSAHVLRSCLSHVMESVLSWELSFNDNVKDSRDLLENSYRLLLQDDIRVDDREFRKTWARFGMEVMDADRRNQRTQDDVRQLYEEKLSALKSDSRIKETDLDQFMRQIEKLSGQLEHQMENVMELHDENRSLREMVSNMEDRMQEYRDQQLASEKRLEEEKELQSKLQKAFVEVAETCGISVPYLSPEMVRYVFQQLSDKNQDLLQEAENNWEKELEGISRFLKSSEIKLTQKGRNLILVEEVISNSPTVTIKVLDDLKESLLQVYKNEMEFIKYALADKENNNNNDCGKCKENGKKEGQIREVSNDEDEKPACIKAAYSFSESYRRSTGMSTVSNYPEYSSNETELLFEKESVSNDPLEWDTLFQKLASISEDNEKDTSESERVVEDSDAETDLSRSAEIFHNDLIRELRSIVQPEGEAAIESETSKAKPPSSPTSSSSNKNEEDLLDEDETVAELKEGATDSGYNSGRSRIQDQVDDYEPVEGEEDEMGQNGYSVDSRYKNAFMSPRSSFIYPMIEEETPQELTDEAEDEDGDYEQDVCDYYAEQCVSNAEDALSIILESDSEDDEVPPRTELVNGHLSGDEKFEEQGSKPQKNKLSIHHAEKQQVELTETCPPLNLESVEEILIQDPVENGTSSNEHLQVSPAVTDNDAKAQEVLQDTDSSLSGHETTLKTGGCAFEIDMTSLEMSALKRNAQKPIPNKMKRFARDDEDKSEMPNNNDSCCVVEDNVQIESEFGDPQTSCPNKQMDQFEINASPHCSPDSSISAQDSNSSSGHLGDTEDHIECGANMNCLDKSQDTYSSKLVIDSEELFEDKATMLMDSSDSSDMSELSLGVEDDGQKIQTPDFKKEEKSQSASLANEPSADSSRTRRTCQTESSQTQTDLAGTNLIEKLSELETAVGEMQEVKVQHMKVACGVAEQLEELKLEEQHWLNKENRYQDEIDAWKQNVELQNSVLQQLREDLENTQNSLQEREKLLRDIQIQMHELQTEYSTPVVVCNLASRESQTEFDGSEDLLAYIDQLRSEINNYVIEMKHQEMVIHEVRQETQGTISHLLNLKAEATEKFTKDSIEWQNILEQKDSEMKRLRSELLHLSELVEVKGVVISQQIKNIKSLLSELGRCEAELKDKNLQLQQLQAQYQNRTMMQRGCQTEEEKLLFFGEACVKEQHSQTIAQQSEIIHQLQDEVGKLTEKLSTAEMVNSNLESTSHNGHINGHSDAYNGLDGEENWPVEADDRAEEDHWKKKPVKQIHSLRVTPRERPLPLPFKNGKILFLQQDLENRRKEILKTEMKLRRIQAKMADEIKKGRAPLKAT